MLTDVTRVCEKDVIYNPHNIIHYDYPINAGFM